MLALGLAAFSLPQQGGRHRGDTAFADADRLQWSPRSLPQAAFSVAGKDCLVIGLAAVDDDALRLAMARQRLAEEAFGRHQVTVFAEI